MTLAKPQLKTIAVTVYFYTNKLPQERADVENALPELKSKMSRTAWRKGVIRVRANHQKGIAGKRVLLNRGDDFLECFNEVLRKSDITLVEWDKNKQKYRKTVV